MRKIGKKKAIAIFVPLGIFLALGIFLLVWFFGANYKKFDEVTRKELPIPGLSSGLSPQGLCPLPEESGFSFAMSGYISGEASRVYLIGAEKVKYVTLTANGAPVSTHFGGITATADSLYVASGREVVRFSLEEALAAGDGAALEIMDTLEVPLRGAAYCYYFNGTLFVGEFYRSGNYETDESHHMSVNGETNYALVYLFRETKDGFERSPYAAISVCGQVQGIAVWEDGIALSTSYGLPDSRILFYENVLNGDPCGEFEGLLLYRLDSTNCRGEWRTPCMSEEIFVKDGRLYVLYESLSKKYRYFVRRRIDSILSAALADIPLS